MTPIATLRSRLARVRTAVTGRLHPPAPPVAPALVNLVPDPGFRGAPDRPLETGGVFVSPHCSCDFTEVPGRPGTTGARVEGVSTGNDTHIAPGGRTASGEFRLGMRPGRTYTASVSVHLAEPLTGALHPAALSLTPVAVADGTTRILARSAPARNECGHHRISVTFTVPEQARGAGIRLVAGMAQGGGVVHFYDYSLIETAVTAEHFDGSTPDDFFHTYAWNGEPDASPSTRRLRTRPSADPAAIGAEAVRLAASGAAEEAALLRSLVPGDRITAARVALALGDQDAGIRALRRVTRDGDPDGAAAYELGRIALAEHRWPAAEKLLRGAVAKRPDAVERGYALAFAYDKLKRRDDSRRATAAALAYDTGLPFDGPAVLGMDVKCYGARRELGLFVAEHLDQIRRQADQRLARPVTSGFDQPIFVYWGQGFDSAPPVVRACLAALRDRNPDSRVHELSDANVGSYVDVPDGLPEALGGDRTHFSDLLRLLLLEKFGGVWVDSTCLVTEPLRPHVTAALERSSLFAFNYTGPYISSWFLAARPGSYPVHLWRAACFLWWERRGELIDYFLMHHVFEMLHHLDERFRAEWDAGLRRGSRPPHALQSVMLQPYDPVAYRTILDGSFAHKLRFKYEPHEMHSESYLARIIRGDLP
ncbi:capsular polysaccharide synthesis protein [Actinoplanes rectilineatus]|uniref:capsular polysaccharide synthesis protein n=1 Tax=Actinoplanes rectilineatus TaxID=113571 RepID=UPI000B0E8EEE|nr:capsular polysaccharide synthesis protein [Actinoplanes rectilineatus]